MTHLATFIAGFALAAYFADIYIKGLRRHYQEQRDAS